MSSCAHLKKHIPGANLCALKWHFQAPKRDKYFPSFSAKMLQNVNFSDKIMVFICECPSLYSYPERVIKQVNLRDGNQSER
jgi:hypothetical protein